MKLRYSLRTSEHDVFVFDDDKLEVVDLGHGTLVGSIRVTPDLIEGLRSALDYIAGNKSTSPIKAKGSTKKARNTEVNA